MKSVFEAAGDVRGVDLLAAFVTIWREATSGSLLFSRAAASAGFDLADGNLVGVHSSELRFETAAILTRAGKLDPGALERLSVPPGTDAALAALSAGLLTKREWKWGEKIRAIEILADLLSWPDGKYVFDSSSRAARGEFVLTIPRLLLELFLRSRDRHLIEHQLGATDVPLLRSETFEEEFATFGLTADAESVVRLIDGRATASEISEKAPAEEFAVLKLLAALKTLGLLATGPGLQATPPVSFAEPEIAVGTGRSPLESWAEASPPPIAPTETPEEEAQSDLAQMPLQEPDSALARGQEKPAPWDSLEPSLSAAPDERGEAGTAREPELPAWEGASVEARREPATELPPEASVEVPPAAPRPGRRWGLLLGAGLLFLIAAVVATVLLRSRLSPIPTETIARRRPTAPAPTAAPAAVFTPPSAPTTAPTAAPTSPPTRARAETVPRPSEARGAAPARASAAEEDRAEWLKRARREQRKLQSDKKTRYAVQLELVCEVNSLVEAWKHDRPAGSLWLLTTSHDGRECFRVLWGRFASLQEARRAKAGIPPYFVTSSNHPAVASVR